MQGLIVQVLPVKGGYAEVLRFLNKLNVARAAHQILSQHTGGVLSCAPRLTVGWEIDPDGSGSGVISWTVNTGVGYQNAVMGLLGLTPYGRDIIRPHSSRCHAALHIMKTVLATLRVMHCRHGVIHGDVRSANVSLHHDGNSLCATLSGFLNMKDARSDEDVAEDVYGFGRFVWELASLDEGGTPPPRLRELIRANPHLSPLAENEQQRHVVTTLVALADACTRPDPKERLHIDTVQQILEQLSDYLGGDTMPGRRVSDAGSAVS